MIDVLVVDDERLVRERVMDLLEGREEIRVVGESGDGIAAVNDILETCPDLVFLDIQMPGLDGFEVLQAVAEEHMPAVVFVTAFDDYALRAFEFHALDYLLKPIDPERFERTLSHAIELARTGKADGLRALVGSLERDRTLERIVARRGRSHVVARIEEIDWIESAGNYLRIQTRSGECILRATMKSMAERLDPTRFQRVHRSALVNIDRVDSMTPLLHGEYEIRMQDGKLLKTGRSYGPEIRKLHGGS